MNLREVTKRVLYHGPSRVLVEPNRTVPPKWAQERYGLEPDIVLIRNDGWTLGAPQHLAREAFALWEGAWTHFLLREETEPRPISSYEETPVPTA